MTLYYKGKAITSSGTTTVDWDSITNKPDVALKSDITTVYRYKGNVANAASLPQQDNSIGDVYNAEDTGMNYAWTGTEWSSLGGAISVDSISINRVDEIYREVMGEVM